MGFRVDLICIGRLKSPFCEVCSVYEKRLKGRMQLRIHEIDVRHMKDEQAMKRRENEEIARRLERLKAPRVKIVSMAIDGQEISTQDLAQTLNFMQSASESLVILIGGSHGLSEEVKKQSDWKWSFSRMTFPHHLFRALLLEQLYRADTILKSEPYHK